MDRQSLLGMIVGLALLTVLHVSGVLEPKEKAPGVNDSETRPIVTADQGR